MELAGSCSSAFSAEPLVIDESAVEELHGVRGGGETDGPLGRRERRRFCCTRTVACGIVIIFCSYEYELTNSH